MSRTDESIPPAVNPVGEEKDAGASAPPARPLNILVAEDNEFNSQLLEQLLGRRGHRVRLAINGRDALSLAVQGCFDLLLLDIHMPEMDGFQVARAIREREQTTGGHLPVIALTARSRKEDRDRCLAAGMDGFLSKPIRADDLSRAIDDVAANLPSANHPPSELAASRLLDSKVLLAACGGEAAILDRISQAFRDRLPEDVAAVRRALNDRDASQLREAAHKLCGIVSTFSTVAGNVASELEDRAAVGQLDETQPLVERLEIMAQELLQLAGNLSLDRLKEIASSAG
jgi:CheY-like chemotaxis protein/HPt (histidine-containing phosphotransfer) domain-containing protein